MKLKIKKVVRILFKPIIVRFKIWKIRRPINELSRSIVVLSTKPQKGLWDKLITYERNEIIARQKAIMKFKYGVYSFHSRITFYS